jgi:type I restriction-modification system DNA methylase subunit
LLTPTSINAPLRDCGYRQDLLKTNFHHGDDVIVPLVGFAQPPMDSRSACVAVLSEASIPTDPRVAVEGCRGLGAPIVFVCFQNNLQWWKQGAESAEYLESVPADQVHGFFQSRQRQFSPEAVYRAKTWGRYRQSDQLSFVDVGLMPLVEEQVGKSIASLVERNVAELKNNLDWNDVDAEQGHWLLKAIFWLLSGKILRDKGVDGFQNLELQDVQDVFRRVARHYGSTPLRIEPNVRVEALSGPAHNIERFSSLALTTTESLGYVYENALISAATRSSLGTHTTPSFLVDYIVGGLRDWIEAIPVDERTVFEPACGQAAFLVSAMRLLTEILPPERSLPSRRGQYLRKRLHGSDVDPFALELARLSLTLTDIPNPDGWDLTVQSMFDGEHIADQASRTTVLLFNAPFENLSSKEKVLYRSRGTTFRFTNKSAEMLWRTLPYLPVGAVFGVVIPQVLLHSNSALEIRKLLLREYELKEICALPDKVFEFSEAESAVVMGRRTRAAQDNVIRYRRIHKPLLESFRSGSTDLPVKAVPKSRFLDDPSFSFRIPDIEEVWTALADNPTLSQIAAVSKGLDYRASIAPGIKTYSERPFENGHLGFVRLNRRLLLHQLPRLYWMNLDSAAVSSPRSGTEIGTPQLLLNYARASRGPWRLKALLDWEGHPVTSRFITVRPRTNYSLEVLWGLLNSPVANAYAFSYLGTRDNVVGDIRRIPLPQVDRLAGVESAVRDYFALAASPNPSTTALRDYLLKVDAEVVRLYSLPLQLEHAVLRLFRNWPRVGVPFEQVTYLPKEVDLCLSLAEFLEFESHWPTTNCERGVLIEKSISGHLTSDERRRLGALQIYADYHLEKVTPRPTRLLERLQEELLSGRIRADSNDDRI